MNDDNMFLLPAVLKIRLKFHIFRFFLDLKRTEKIKHTFKINKQNRRVYANLILD